MDMQGSQIGRAALDAVCQIPCPGQVAGANGLIHALGIVPMFGEELIKKPAMERSVATQAFQGGGLVQHSV